MNAILMYELSTVLDPNTFRRLLKDADAYSYSDNEAEYVDTSVKKKGMIVTFCNDARKTIRILFTVPYNSDVNIDPNVILQMMRKQISRYFNKQFKLENLVLSRLTVAAILRLDRKNRAEDYMTILSRVGNVKGFTLHSELRSGEYVCHHWRGNSNATDIVLCSLDKNKGCVKSLHLTVQMQKSSAVRAYTNETDITEQIRKTLTKMEGPLVELLFRAIPFGMFLKKGAAVDRIRTQVGNDALRRKMIRLLDLIPEKKSLKLAIKASGYRNPRDIMLAFARINLSPVTISKRMYVRKLNNLYLYL